MSTPNETGVPTHDFKVGGAVVTVRQEVGWDVSDSRIVWRKLIAAGAVDPTSERDTERAWGDFIPAVVKTVSIEGDLGFAWVTVMSSAEELGAAYTEFGKRATLAGGFLTAFNTVENLTPGTEATSAKKNVTPQPQVSEPVSAKT